MKKDVLTTLPAKNEQVLFCQLTDIQRKEYEDFLKTDEVTSILAGKRNVLFGIDILRKVCNHPDLVKRVAKDRPVDYGNPERSGKLKVGTPRKVPLIDAVGTRATSSNVERART